MSSAGVLAPEVPHGSAQSAPISRELRIVVIAMVALIAAACTPYASRIRADHAREFGCQERWVRVTEAGPRRWEATGCGFQSDWVCAEQQCRMRDHRSFGVDAP